MSKYLFIVFCWILPISSELFAQLPSYLVLRNKVYADIHSVKLTVKGSDFGLPIIKLNENEKLKLCFDDLNLESRNLKYTFFHCTYDWKLSDINQMEYLDVYQEDNIYDYSHSMNTLQEYLHYEAIFPNENISISKSGNYILYVYDDELSNPVLTRRFMVYDERFHPQITINQHDASDISFRKEKQEIDFSINMKGITVINPATYLNTAIIQNERWDNAIIGLGYRTSLGNEFIYDYNDNENVFNGAAEFRYFDIRTLRYTAGRIVSISFKNRINQAYLVEDIARPYGAYVGGKTLNGACYYKNSDFNAVNSEDYVNTHFALKTDFNVSGGSLYVFGELTDWQIQPDAQLQFNPQSNYWETELYLKQGYYNYQYVYVKDNSTIIDETYIEGNHWQTENDYTILVYLRDATTVYDQLIGFKTINFTTK